MFYRGQYMDWLEALPPVFSPHNLVHFRSFERGFVVVRGTYDKEGTRMRVALGGPVGSGVVGPRELGSGSLRRLVCVEGLAVMVSGVKPKVVRSVHYCPATC